MDLFINILIALISIIVTWLIAEPYRVPRWIALNRHDNWHGVWFCRWSPKAPNDDGWLTEKVSLKHSMGKLKIELADPADEYRWEATMTLKKNYLIGEWRSVKAHSNSQGTVQLMITNQGNSMLGYFVGPHINDRLTIYRFILAETESELERLTRDFKKLL